MTLEEKDVIPYLKSTLKLESLHLLVTRLMWIIGENKDNEPVHTPQKLLTPQLEGSNMMGIGWVAMSTVISLICLAVSIPKLYLAITWSWYSYNTTAIVWLAFALLFGLPPLIYTIRKARKERQD